MLAESIVQPEPDQLGTLIDELEDLERHRRFSEAWKRERNAVERRLLALLSPNVEVERRSALRVPCDLWVRIHSARSTRPGVIDDVGTGGVFVSTLMRAEVGQTLLIEIPEDPVARTAAVRVPGKVAWTGSKRRQGLGVAFDPPIPTTERALHRMVLRLLRSRLPAELARLSG